jgi:microsomal epoxide hydrolase
MSLVLRRLARPSWLCLVLLALPRLAPAQAIPGVQDGWVTTSDLHRLHYLTAGSGPTIVFVPGWTMPAEIWEPQLRHFMKDYHVVALDPRSQGRSDHTSDGNNVERRAQDIHELLQQLGGASVLVGWSLAAIEALQMTDTYGTANVRGLVLVDGQISVDSDSATQAYLSRFLMRVLIDRKAFTAQFVKGMFKTPQTQGYLDRLTKAALTTPTGAAHDLINNAYGSGPRDWRPALSRVDRPVLFIGGAGSAPGADAVRAILPSAQTVTFDQAGHAMFVDEPDHFNQVLEAFITGLK